MIFLATGTCKQRVPIENRLWADLNNAFSFMQISFLSHAQGVQWSDTFLHRLVCLRCRMDNDLEDVNLPQQQLELYYTIQVSGVRGDGPPFL